MRIPGWWRVQRTLLNKKLRKFNHTINFDPSNNFLVFSDPRGGSTWVTEMVKDITQSAIIWEPLSLVRYPVFKTLGFAWRQFIAEHESRTEVKDAFEQLFRGQHLNYWTASKTNVAELQSAQQLLIKFCRGNQLLPWLTTNFQFKFKPVYVVRHPFAVVASQLKQGAWNFEFQPATSGPYSSLSEAEKQFVMALETKEEMLTATWCLCNRVPLSHAKNNEHWITINYEELVLNPKETLARVLDEWGITYDLDSIDFGRQSATTVSGSPISGNKQIEYWKTKLSADQISRMTAVLDYFQINAYSADPYPVINYSENKRQGV